MRGAWRAMTPYTKRQSILPRSKTLTPGKVLVLGADSRSGLAAVRSLGRAGINVHVASHHQDPITIRSRYLHTPHTIPAYAEATTEWLSGLRAILERERFDVVIPTNDMWVTALQRHRTELAPYGNLYLLNEPAFDIFFDKMKTRDLACSLGIPVPEEIVISRLEDTAAASSLGFPLVLKPARSLNESAGGARNVVRQVFSEAELIQQSDAMLQMGPVAAQRFVAGHGVGVELLTCDGEPLLTFQHQRMHEAFGSGSSYRKGVAPSTHLVDAALQMLRNVRYTGVAMVEFRVDPCTNTWVLLEINARFWGSLPLALASKVDFPIGLYQLLTHGEIDMARTYRPGLYCRSLSMDLPWYLENVKRARASPIRHARTLFKDCARGAVNVLTLRERIDTLAFDDPMPFLAELVGIATIYGDRLRARLRRRLSSMIQTTSRDLRARELE